MKYVIAGSNWRCAMLKQDENKCRNMCVNDHVDKVSVYMLMVTHRTWKNLEEKDVLELMA